jgi:hypothetical protein
MRTAPILLATLLASATAAFSEEAAPRAARSVHLFYPAPASAAFYNELTVEASVNGSYFMACGFNRGYFGIQQLGSENKKVVIFSIWDPTKGDDPKAVPEEKRVDVLGSGEGVRVSRFGGEGTGGKSMWDYAWKVGATYRFLVRATVDGDATTYTAHFFVPERGNWQHMATFRTHTGGKPLGGYYSFVEDFHRDGKSPNEIRRARFGNGWIKPVDGEWKELREAKFTADGTKLDNIDAGVAGTEFYLATGGDTTTTNKLGSKLERPASGKPAPDPMREIDKPQ